MLYVVPKLYRGVAPAFFVTLGLLSIADFVLGLEHSGELSHELVDPYMLQRGWGRIFSKVQIGFYCATLPLVSSVYSIVEAAFYFFSDSFRPVMFSSAGAMVLFLGWTTQMAFWTICEESAEGDGGSSRLCPQSAIINLTATTSALDTPVQKAKYSIGWILTVGYLAYMIFLAILIIVVGKKKEVGNASLDQHVESNEVSKEHYDT